VRHPLSAGQGAAALTAAMAEDDPDSLAAGARLRRDFPAELAAAALSQASLRRRARAKFGEAAGEMLFTPDGLEQASRPEVAAWRARRFAEAGVSRIVDLGCGIGADALALAHAGLGVVAVERDPATAAVASANLEGTGATVVVADATEAASDLLGPGTAVFCDPARRTGRGRSWRVEDFSPPWSFVCGLLDGRHAACVKLGPGLPRELVPDDVEACWVSHRGDVVEAGLWRLPGGTAASVAELLPSGDRVEGTGRRLPVAAPGRYILEPDGAVIRARAVGDIIPGAWLLDAEVAYLSTDEPVVTPFASVFEVLETMDTNERTLRTWVREHHIGTLEIKKRALDLDPAALRRRLRPAGPHQATLILARTAHGARAFVVRRV